MQQTSCKHFLGVKVWKNSFSASGYKLPYEFPVYSPIIP